MKVKNIYVKRLSFEWDDLGSFSIDTNEEREVSNEMGNRLLSNTWIKEIEKEEIIQTNESNININKGRKKKNKDN